MADKATGAGRSRALVIVAGLAAMLGWVGSAAFGKLVNDVLPSAAPLSCEVERVFRRHGSKEGPRALVVRFAGDGGRASADAVDALRGMGYAVTEDCKTLAWEDAEGRTFRSEQIFAEMEKTAQEWVSGKDPGRRPFDLIVTGKLSSNAGQVRSYFLIPASGVGRSQELAATSEFWGRVPNQVLSTFNSYLFYAPNEVDRMARVAASAQGLAARGEFNSRLTASRLRLTAATAYWRVAVLARDQPAAYKKYLGQAVANYKDLVATDAPSDIPLFDRGPALLTFSRWSKLTGQCDDAVDFARKISMLGGSGERAPRDRDISADLQDSKLGAYAVLSRAAEVCPTTGMRDLRDEAFCFELTKGLVRPEDVAQTEHVSLREVARYRAKVCDHDTGRYGRSLAAARERILGDMLVQQIFGRAVSVSDFFDGTRMEEELLLSGVEDPPARFGKLWSSPKAEGRGKQ